MIVGEQGSAVEIRTERASEIEPVCAYGFGYVLRVKSSSGGGGKVDETSLTTAEALQVAALYSANVSTPVGVF